MAQEAERRSREADEESDVLRHALEERLSESANRVAKEVSHSSSVQKLTPVDTT